MSIWEYLGIWEVVAAIMLGLAAAMTVHPLADLSVLDRFKTGGPFPPGYPSDTRTFYSPVDDVHGCLVYLIKAATKSLIVAMYGFDDDDLADALRSKLVDEQVFVQLTLDKTQAGGVAERKLLAREHFPISSVATGGSEHGRIMHMKLLIIDGSVLVTGSTNWSDPGETLQDNELTVTLSAAKAAEARMRVDQIHQHMLSKGHR
jgi:phosphatidylserine/phosphatidylglycerophosphate/cardiolipin synthase-like enzyme